jgi:hypothetical protein
MFDRVLTLLLMIWEIEGMALKEKVTSVNAWWPRVTQ